MNHYLKPLAKVLNFFRKCMFTLECLGLESKETNGTLLEGCDHCSGIPTTK